MSNRQQDENRDSDNTTDIELDWVNLLLENYTSSNTPLPSFSNDSGPSNYNSDPYSYQFVTTKANRGEPPQYQKECENNKASYNIHGLPLPSAVNRYGQDEGFMDSTNNVSDRDNDATDVNGNKTMWMDSDNEEEHHHNYQYAPSFTEKFIAKASEVNSKNDHIVNNTSSTVSVSSSSSPSTTLTSSISSYWTNPSSIITYASLLPIKSAMLHTFQLSLKQSSKLLNQTILNVQIYVDSNPKLTQTKDAILDTTGCMSESVLYLSDRMSSVTEEYIRHTITADDPDTQHMKHLISDFSWETLPLRCSLASLTWTQLQLVDTATATYSSSTAQSNHSSTQSLVNRDSNKYRDNCHTTTTGNSIDVNKEWLLYHQRACHRQHSSAMYRYLLTLKTAKSTTSAVAACPSKVIDMPPNPLNNNSSQTFANNNNTNDITSSIGSDSSTNDCESDSGWVDEQSSSPNSFSSTASSSSVTAPTGASDDQWWLATRAQQGDVEAQYALSKWFAPPAFEEVQSCRVCQRIFGARLFRHHCRMCGHSLCGTHSSHKRVILHLGYTSPVRCCHECSVRLDAEAHYNQLHWRELRVQGYLHNALVPYSSAVSVVDTRARKALRVVDASITVAKRAASFNYPAYLVLQTVDILRRYGMSGLAGVLMRQDFFYAVETLKRITGVDLVFRMSLHELTACIYYKLAVDRGLRGCDHEGEKRMHEEEEEKEVTELSDVSNRNSHNIDTTNDQNNNQGFPSYDTIQHHQHHQGQPSPYNSYHNFNHDDLPNQQGKHYYQQDLPQQHQYQQQQQNQPQQHQQQYQPSKLSPSKRRLRRGNELIHELNDAIRLVPLALQAVYEPTAVECQRVAASQGWLTVLCCSDSAAEQPAYALFASVPPTSSSSSSATSNNVNDSHKIKNYDYSNNSNNNNNNNRHGIQTTDRYTKSSPQIKKEAVLAVRGTYSVHDLVTDIRAAPHRFPPSVADVSDAVQGVFRHKDPESSYGAAQRVDIPASNGATSSNKDNNNNNNNSISHDNGVINMKTSNSSSSNTTSTNSTEDEGFVPVSVSQWEWTMDMQDAQYACRGMAVSALWLLTQVAPSLLTLAAEGYDIVLTGHSLGAGVAVLLTEMLKESIPLIRAVVFGCPCCVDAVTADVLKERVISIVLHDDFISRVTPKTIRLLMRDLYVFRSQVFTHLSEDWRDVMARAATLWSPRWREPHPQSELQPLSKKQNNSSHTNYTTTTNNNKYTSNRSTQEIAADRNRLLESNGDAAAATAAVDSSDSQQSIDPTDHNNTTSSTSDTDIQSDWFLSEDVIADLWLPGTLLHVYSYHGQYHIAEVNRTFLSLRRIEVQGNMFADHTSNDIFDALLEARAVLTATTCPPVWTSYDAVDRCECCLNAFTWHSTFRGQAQEYRERHNCRNCGKLVCDPCSSHTRPIPRLGLIFPARICDTCFFRGDYASSSSSS